MNSLSWKFHISATLFTLLALYIALSINIYYPPELNPDEYWGPGLQEDHTLDYYIHRFRIEPSVSKIDDLKRKLHVNSTVPVLLADAHADTDVNRLQALLGYWRDDYLPAWESRQRFLNSFPQYTTEVQG